ncbi:MAG: 16S rRNA (adenine(1518)-N(6)/adenine(1519)-N(6))-dimethyltransferase RsmA [Patescibacteria group bacterium]
MDLTDLATINQLLTRYRIWPTKEKGQNFLIDQEVLDKIIAAADLDSEDLVLEIGPGLGVLTQELVKRAKNVLAVELDRQLVKVLENNLKDCQNLQILAGDILKIKNSDLAQDLGQPYKVVANLPYNITAQILRKFLSYTPKPQQMVLMVQKEVAERVTALPGQLSLVALAVQLYGQPEIVSVVSRQSFYPEPAVDSAILKISQIDQIWQFTPQIEKRFWQLAKIGFASRRKQLQNNLVAGLKLSSAEVKNGLVKAKLDPLIRAQDLGVGDWLKLSTIF